MAGDDNDYSGFPEGKEAMARYPQHALRQSGKHPNLRCSGPHPAAVEGSVNLSSPPKCPRIACGKSVDRSPETVPGAPRSPTAKPEGSNAPARTRTWDRRIRNPMLYPAELRAQMLVNTTVTCIFCFGEITYDNQTPCNNATGRVRGSPIVRGTRRHGTATKKQQS